MTTERRTTRCCETCIHWGVGFGSPEVDDFIRKRAAGDWQSRTCGPLRMGESKSWKWCQRPPAMLSHALYLCGDFKRPPRQGKSKQGELSLESGQ